MAYINEFYATYQKEITYPDTRRYSGSSSDIEDQISYDMKDVYFPVARKVPGRELNSLGSLDRVLLSYKDELQYVPGVLRRDFTLALFKRIIQTDEPQEITREFMMKVFDQIDAEKVLEG